MQQIKEAHPLTDQQAARRILRALTKQRKLARSHEFAMRQLVAVWYLNSLENQGGETEFRYQDIKVTPEAGMLLLFPPFWTHLHRGKTLQSGVKYIATTWVVFA